MKFYNRENELNAIENIKEKYFIVLWGRRRIGKTSLALKAFKESLYFFVSKKTSELLLEEFSDVVRANWKYIPTFKNWEEFFRFLFDEYSGPIIIDEFQNFRFVDESVFSILQKIVDSSKGYKMVAIGSYVGMMKHIFMDAKEPLYGRTTGIMRLRPLKFSKIYQILDDLGFRDFEEKVKIYSIFGGIPYYYTLLENYEIKSFEDCLKILVFSPLAPLKYEVKTVLLEEFGRNYRSYFSILQSIAQGKSTMTEIADKSGVEIKSISKYLKELAEIYGLIERITPIDKVKKGIYRISDPFTKFWFRYVESHLSNIESGYGYQAIKKVIEEINRISSLVFESIIKEIIEKESDRVGSWWNRLGQEIDIVGIDKDVVTFCEVKWKRKKIGKKVLVDLRKKSDMVLGFKKHKKKFIIVSKFGFKFSADEEDVELWDIDDVVEKLGVNF